MSVTPQQSKVDELIRRLDEAMEVSNDDVRCRNVKKVLMDVVKDGGEFLDPRFLAATPDCYARRLIHHDPNNRYTALAMVWDRGQGTPQIGRAHV